MIRIRPLILCILMLFSYLFIFDTFHTLALEGIRYVKDLKSDVWSVALSADGSYVAAGSADNKVYLFGRDGRLLWSHEADDDVTSVALSADGYTLAFCYQSYVYAHLLRKPAEFKIIKFKIPESVLAGKVFLLTATIKNVGKEDALNVIVDIMTPSEISLSTKRKLTFDIVSKNKEFNVSWNLKALAPGEYEIKIAIKADNAEPLEKRVKIKVSAGTMLNIIYFAVMPEEVKVGDEFSVVFVLENTGELIAENVKSLIMLPPGLELSSGETLVKHIGNIDSRDIAEVSWKIKALKSGDYPITIRVISKNAPDVMRAGKVIVRE